MRKRLFLLAGVAALLGGEAASTGYAADTQHFPGVPGGLPDGWRDFGEERARPKFDFGLDGFRARPGIPSPRGRADRPDAMSGGATASDRAQDAAAARAAKQKAARAEKLKEALAPHEPAAARRGRALEDLFKRLQASSDPEESQKVAASIERVWLQSPSDSAELLMQRALVSLQAQDFQLALSLLDKVLALEPEWAEAWNQRATARFLADDLDGAMADIDHVLKLEPRHFGALAGMGLILERAGFAERALQVFDKALAIYPSQPDLQKNAEKLRLQIEGRDI